MKIEYKKSISYPILVLGILWIIFGLSDLFTDKGLTFPSFIIIKIGLIHTALYIKLKNT